ncbi:MAG: hypothetical protein JO266_09490 [Acidobacteria bacterium]|nr:hypothetical protein [Acidobacteriota bacterium]MBV8892182.1 hypothetical protein [Acidobacteriota bacterium]
MADQCTKFAALGRHGRLLSPLTRGKSKVDHCQDGSRRRKGDYNQGTTTSGSAGREGAGL